MGWRNEASSNFKELLAWIFATFTKDKQEDFAIRAWQLWGRRNELLFQQKACTPELALTRAHDFLNNFRKAGAKKGTVSARTRAH